MLINHNISLDRELYPQYSHQYNFILCHKNFEDRFGDVANKIYITDNKEYAANSGAILIDKNEYDSRVFGELPFWIYISKQIREQDSASLMAYRRKLYPKIGIQVAQPLNLPCTVLEQLAYYHSPFIAETICKVLPPEEVKILNGNLLCAYNIFSAPYKVIVEWINFVIPRLEQIMKAIGCPNDFKSVKEWVKTTDLLKPYEGKNSDLVYQSRVGAFILERLNTVFWLSRNYGQQWQPVKLLEPGQTI